MSIFFVFPKRILQILNWLTERFRHHQDRVLCKLYYDESSFFQSSSLATDWTSEYRMSTLDKLSHHNFRWLSIFHLIFPSYWHFSTSWYKELSNVLTLVSVRWFLFVITLVKWFIEQRFSDLPASNMHLKTIWEHTCDNSPTVSNWWSFRDGIQNCVGFPVLSNTWCTTWYISLKRHRSHNCPGS